MAHRPPSGTPPADEAARRAREGDADAIAELCRLEFPVIHRLCLGFLADPADADDLAQDAMVRLLDRLPRWDPARPLAAWRNTVVLNLCRDHLRSQRRRHLAWERLRLLPPPGARGPVEALEQAELRGFLASSLAQLPPREREAFVLHDLEGLSTAEAAATMDIQEASVRSLLTLARRRLRRLLAPILDGTGADPGRDAAT